MNPNEASANKTQQITTNTTTIIPVPANPKGKLVLIRLVINKKGASSNTATIYDSDEDTGADVGQRKGILDTTDRVGNVEYGFPVYKGIYIVTETGTAPDITVVWKEIL